MSLRIASFLVMLSASAVAQSVHTVGPTGDFAAPQDAIDAAAPGDIVLLQQAFTANVVIDKGLVFAGGGFGLVKPGSGPGAAQPVIHIAGVPAGQSVLVTGLQVFTFGGGPEAAVLVEDCAGPVWIQDTFVDSYGAQALRARDVQTLVCTDAPLQVNLVPALPDGTPQPAPGARLDGATRAWFHGAHIFGSHGALQGSGNPVPNAAPDGGIGLLVTDAQAKLFGTQVTGGAGNSFTSGGCTTGGNGGVGLLTADGPDAGSPAVALRGSVVAGGNASFFTCGPAPSPGAAFDVVPGSLTTSSATLRRFDIGGLVEPGQQLTLAFDGVGGDLALLFGAAAPAPAATVGSFDLHLAAGSMFPLGTFALPGIALDVNVTVPALPAGFEALVVPLQAFFLDTQGGKHASEPRAVVIH